MMPNSVFLQIPSRVLFGINMWGHFKNYSSKHSPIPSSRSGFKQKIATKILNLNKLLLSVCTAASRIHSLLIKNCGSLKENHFPIQWLFESSEIKMFNSFIKYFNTNTKSLGCGFGWYFYRTDIRFSLSSPTIPHVLIYTTPVQKNKSSLYRIS